MSFLAKLKSQLKKFNRNTDDYIQLSPEVLKAKAYIESIHASRNVFLHHNPNDAFRYIGSSKNGQNTRYHFQKGVDANTIYVVLSDKERNKIKRKFQTEMGNNYNYEDSIITPSTGFEVQHRFYKKNSDSQDVVLMSDSGKFWIVNPFSKNFF